MRSIIKKFAMAFRGNFQAAWDEVYNNKRIAYIFTKFIHEHYNEHEEYIAKWMPILKTLEMEDFIRIENAYPGFLQYSRTFNNQHKGKTIQFEKEFENLWKITLNVEDDLLHDDLIDGPDYQVDTNGDIYTTPQRKRIREPSLTGTRPNKRISDYPPGGRDLNLDDTDNGKSFVNLLSSTQWLYVNHLIKILVMLQQSHQWILTNKLVRMKPE